MYVELSDTTVELIVKVLSTIMPVTVLVMMMASLIASKISTPDFIHVMLGEGLPSAVQLNDTGVGITTETEGSESWIKMGMAIIIKKGRIHYICKKNRCT